MPTRDDFADMTPGAVLRQLRHQLDLTQQALADALGYDRRDIVRWESDKFFPSPPSLHDVCAFFKIEPEILYRARTVRTSRRRLSEVANAFAALKSRLQDGRPKYDVVSLSLHNVDWIHQVDNIEPDYETTIGRTQRSAGGSGANTLSTLGQLGLRVGAIGIVAADSEGKFLIAELQSASVDTTGIFVSDEPGSATGYTNIYADAGGRRTIYNSDSVNNNFAASYRKHKLDAIFLERVRASKLLHISSFPEPAALAVQEEIVKELSGNQIFSFNPGSFQSKFGLNRLGTLLQRANILFAYDNQLVRMLADAGHNEDLPSTDHVIQKFFRWRSDQGHKEPFILILKNSPELVRSKSRKEYITAAASRGRSYVLAKTDHLQVPLKYARCVDSTGAGDNCAAGMIYGLFKLDTVEETVDLAFGLALRVSCQMGSRLKIKEDDIRSLRYFD